MNFAKRRKRQKSFRKQYDETATNLPPDSVGDKIYFQLPEGKEWSKGEIIKTIGSRTYIIRAANGRTYKRNRVHIYRNLGQKLNKIKYDDHTCIPILTNDSNLDDLTTATNSTSPHEENTCQRPTQRRLPNKLRKYVVY